MLNILKKTGSELIDKASDGLSYGTNMMVDCVKEVNSTIIDASGTVIGHVSKTGEIIADTSLNVVNSLSDISSDTKEQIFSFIEENKEPIIKAINPENTTNELTEQDFEIFVFKIIHGLLPFPLYFILPEEIFINFCTKNYYKIKPILGI